MKFIAALSIDPDACDISSNTGQNVYIALHGLTERENSPLTTIDKVHDGETYVQAQRNETFLPMFQRCLLHRELRTVVLFAGTSSRACVSEYSCNEAPIIKSIPLF